MAENQKPEDFFEDPLEELLDEESDAEFGLPEFKEHLADHLKPAKLKDWTAADFASIYVRFRPHLERHARRFLVNPSQVEEVVQDAFLYLMTTLPELDSEVGVLKFLKWKTRLLALDVIRANSRASIAPIDDVPEMAATDPELSRDMERADDAAIVALAMAKLQPRHREALIATLYEEKSQEVVAAQMGLSENALRQLLFRARASFKKALVGEAETAGKSVSEILSIAARKAAAESGKYLSAAGAFLLVLAISIGILPNLGNQPATLNADAPQATQSAQSSTEAESGSAVTEAESGSALAESTESVVTEEPTEQVEAEAELVAEQPAVEEAPVVTVENPVVIEAPSIVSVVQPIEVNPEPVIVNPDPVVEEPVAEVVQPEPAPTPTPTVTQLPTLSEEDFELILATNVSQAGFYTASKAAAYSDFFQGESIEVFGGTGISAFVYVNPTTLRMENAMFQMWVDGKRYYAIAGKSRVINDGLNLGFEGSNFYVVDDNGRVYDQSPLARATAKVTLVLDENGQPVRASLKIND